MRYVFIVLGILMLSLSAKISHIPCIQKCPDRLSVYEKAEIITGASSLILRAIAMTESDEMDWATGDDGLSEGRFQWNRKYLAYHRGLFGYFDPRDPLLGTIRAGQLYMHNLAYLGNSDMAIRAHNCGPIAAKFGVSMGYLAKVKANERKLSI